MIKQCKAKMLDKIPASKLNKDILYYASIKYDGNYTQIHKIGNDVHFFTSGGKEFYLPAIADYLVANNKNVDFKLECEYINETDGKLGDRGAAARLTTYTTNFSKGIKSISYGYGRFMVFDCMYFKDSDGLGYDVGDVTFKIRTHQLNKLNLGYNLVPVTNVLLGFDDAKAYARSVISAGFEGVILKSETHKYYAGKRVNNAIKIKMRPTADLLCIDTLEGEGKYTGMIGSLVLQDKEGRTVKVGSGLNDTLRSKSADYFTGKVIEIEYEQIIDTYIQPTFIAVREDKKDID